MTVATSRTTDPAIEHHDVLIVGGGISGIDAAYHLKTLRPHADFLVLEGKADIGGTWQTHTFPGIRSDSDLYTFGFKWKPWTGVPIATGGEILRYLHEAVEENGLSQKFRFGCQVKSAEWSNKTGQWVLSLDNAQTGEAYRLSCRFLWMCTGYYRHSQGHTPQLPGMDRFKGPIVHPQTWPDDLDYAGKKVVVIGSGATAATIVPAMAQKAAHVTMLQRSPTFFFPRPKEDRVARLLHALRLPDKWFHAIMRRKVLFEQQLIHKRSFEKPQWLADQLIGGARAYLGRDFDIETHFTPRYRPWQQRIAVIPDGDLYVAMRGGRASVVTDGIETFTARGIRLKSGKALDADIVVTATGLNVNVFGDITLKVDGKTRDMSKAITHRGIMFTGLPNFATVFGYLRTAWTMRADLVSEYVCRLLDHMDERSAHSVTPALREEDVGMETRPWIEPDNFNPGYLARALPFLPRQGDHQPWVMTQDYYQDRTDLPNADFDDGTLVYA